MLTARLYIQDYHNLAIYMPTPVQVFSSSARELYPKSATRGVKCTATRHNAKFKKSVKNLNNNVKLKLILLLYIRSRPLYLLLYTTPLH